MISKRVNLIAGTILGGALLLGTAGFALAQDPTTSPAPSAPIGMSGGMMGAGMGAGMGGQLTMGAGMGAGMGVGQMPDMTAMHAAMGKDGTCDPKLMPSMHRQDRSTR